LTLDYYNMQKETKNIDRLFHDASKDFEKEPPLYAWDKLNDALDKKEEKKRRLVYMYKIAASVAIILSLLGGYYISKHQRSGENNIAYHKTTQLKNKENNFKTPKSTEHQNIGGKTSIKFINNSIKSNKAINKTSIKNNSKENINYKNQIEQDTNTISNNSNYMASNRNNDTIKKDNNITTEKETALDPNINKNQIDSNILANKPPEIKIEQSKISPKVLKDKNNNTNSWSLEGEISPGYSYGNINNSANSKYKNNPITVYSGGLNVSYFNIYGRFGIETGVLYSGIGQEETYAMIYVNKNFILGGYWNTIPDPKDIVLFNPNPLFHIETSAGNIQFNSNDFSLGDIASNQNSTENSSFYIYPANYTIIQKFRFIEIPLIAKYKIINRKIGVNIIGGFSAAYLVMNNSFILKDDKNYEIGKTENINTFMYNSILGIGLKYAIYNNISMNIEPNFKYALKPINKNHTSKYVPYSISMSMGICYDFK